MTAAMERPTNHMTLAAYRNSVLARVSAPVGALALALSSACILRAAVRALLEHRGLLETVVDVAGLLVYPSLVVLPSVVVHACGRPDLVQTACISSHLLRTVAAWCSGLGLSPLPEMRKALCQLRVELILELALSFQDQMSLPIMAVLQGLRQASYAAIYVRWLDHDLFSALLRASFNWVLLMVLAWFFERRMRSGYQRQLQQQQQQLTAQSCAAAPSQLPADDTEFVSSLPSPVKPQAGAGSACDVSKSECLCADRALPARCKPFSADQDSLFPEAAAKAVQSTAGSLSACAAGCKPVPCICDAADQSVCAAEHGDGSYGSSSTVDGRASLVVGAAQLPASAFLDPAVAVSAASTDRSTMSLRRLDGLGPHDMQKAIMQMVNQQRTLTYKTKRQRAARVVHVKVEGLELEQLPADLPRLLHSGLSHCMPGVSMAGLALRSGCVLMTIDLLSLADGSMEGSAEAMRLVMAQLMQSTTMDRGLEDGTTMHIQSPDELMLCQWNAASGGYIAAPAPTAGALDPANLAACGFVGTLPAVLCLEGSPPTADGTASHQLTLTVELELPSNCPLHGWQPDGALASAGVEQEDGAAMHAMLLARRLDGGYLPVVVQRVTPADMQVANFTTVQVMMTLDGVAPAALNLELWCKQHVSGDAQGTMHPVTAANELLVSHMPLLVLPSSWKEATVELLQHVTDMGGVQPYRALPLEDQTLASDPSSHAASSLVHDLGLLLTHCQRLSTATQADTPYALPDAAISQLGSDLLVYTVRQGLGAVAGMIVDTMQRAEQPGAALLSSRPKGSPSKADWLLRAAGCLPSSMQGGQTSLLHAAMASGELSILEMVLKWGSLYGGPWWAWPWELEDAKGCTALHVAAAQSASTCIGLLDTLTSTLPAAQVQAARSAWLHCPGSVNITPAELFARDPNGPSAGVMWVNQATASTAQPAQEIVGTAHSSSQLLDASSCRAVGASGPSAAGSSSSPSVAAARLPLTGTSDQSWLGSMVEAWTMDNTQEYRAWAQGQMSGLVRSWAATMTIMAFMTWYRSVVAGCKLYEAPHLLLHNAPYIPMAMATSGATWLGSWQNWMVAVHVFHALAYLAKLYVPEGMASAWHTSAQHSADAVYVVALTAVLDQSPLPLLAIAQTCVAYCHGLAYATAGVSHPMLRGFIIHGLALVVTTVARARQLRAYRRWQAAQKGNSQAAALAQAEKKAKTE